MIEKILFLAFGSMAVLFGLGMVLIPNPVYVIVFLLFSLISISGVFFVSGAELVGAIQLIVYAVAVAIFYILVLTAVPWRKLKKEDSHNRFSFIVLFTSGVLIIAEILLILGFGIRFSKNNILSSIEKSYGNTNFIASFLFTKYFYGFELLSLLLLVGMIGAILLAKKEKDVYEDTF